MNAKPLFHIRLLAPVGFNDQGEVLPVYELDLDGNLCYIDRAGRVILLAEALEGITFERVEDAPSSLPLAEQLFTPRLPAPGERFTSQEIDLIATCASYSEHPCGLPGHNLMVLIAKLYGLVANAQKILTR